MLLKDNFQRSFCIVFFIIKISPLLTPTPHPFQQVNACHVCIKHKKHKIIIIIIIIIIVIYYY